MNSDELIGKVGTLYLRGTLETDGSEGTARFIIDRLSARQTAAIAKAILADDALSSQIEICLPAHFMDGQGLPDTVITYERATYHRHAKCDKPALLLATTGDDEAQSLNLLTPIGSSQLTSVPELWIEVAASGLALLSEEQKWWEKSLKGLFELNIWSTEQISEYVIYTRKAHVDEGHPILHALGSALHALHVPKDTCFFNGIKAQHRGHASRWRNLYESAYRKRGCYLSKLTPNQTLLNEEVLLKAFDKAKPAIADKYHDLINEFIEAPTGWNDKARSLSGCEWEDVGQHLFEGLRQEKKTIGELTFEFYDEREHELLTDEEWDYLERLKERRKSPHKSEEDEQFYEDHRNELKDDRQLKSLWDRFIFGTATESTDFLKGLVLCIETLFTQKQPSLDARMVIRCDRRSKKDFKDLNIDAGQFFACRYRGLRELFGSKVEWKVDPLFSFAELVEGWRKDSKTRLCTSVAKAALQIKFTIELEVDLLTGGTEKYLTQLVWKFNPNRVETEFYQDFTRLAQHPLVFCATTREPVSTKGEFQPLDLTNVRSFAAARRDRGSFVPVYKKSNDIAELWSDNLSQAKKHGLISESAIDGIENKFKAFKESYTGAIKGFLERGVAYEGLLKQLSDFSELIERLCRDARGDRNRVLLLGPLLKIGAISVDGEKPTVIAAPWHPLKLTAMAVKARQVSDLLRRFLDTEEVIFGDTGRFFFNDLCEALDHPYYPEVILGWQDQKAELLSLTDVVGDYSLYEVPVVTSTGTDGTNDNPSGAANLVADLVDRYLKLQPHEQANLSIVLYNCDSVRLPKAVVEKIRVQHEEDEDVLCQVILRHRSSQCLRNLYETIIEGSDEEVDSFSPSEATRDFMARLRINIMADQAPPPDPRDGCPMDIVFSQDVIARRAGIAWYPENAQSADLLDLIPSHWSRRRPAAKDDMKSVVYLCCPTQSREGWAYLTAITTFIKGDWDEKMDYRLLPARQLDFQEPEMVSIFQETHNLATWVVNYDELLDRRQLINQGVQVIRYKQSATQGRNMIISSNAPMGMLEAMLNRRLNALNIGLDDPSQKMLALRMWQDANEISGDIVLRAAKRGRNASELIGIVLSRFLIRHELSGNQYFGWYFLDDYADWLGQREQQIADILALSPSRTEDGKLRLDIIVSEAKYIDISNLSSKRKESQKQLRDTLSRIDDALFGSPERLDRKLWLAKLSDLVLDGVQVPSSSTINLSDWRRAIREGQCDIFLRGYSHIFVSGPSDSPECSELSPVVNCDNAYQEVFSRAKVRKLILSYLDDTDPISIRRKGMEDDIWASKIYRDPTGEIEVVEKPPIGGKTGKQKHIQHEDDHGRTDLAWNNLKDQINQKIDTEDVIKNGKKDHLDSFSSWPYEGVIQFLEEYHGSATENQEANQWLTQIESRCRGALQQFQLQAKLLSSILTPNAALLKFQGSANLTVEQVLKRRSEFLTTYGLDLISVRAEPEKVAISIARPDRRVLRLAPIWKSWKPNCAGGNHALLIGLKEEDSSPLFLSPKVNAPHTLIAGSTGSGKSVLMQNIILGIAATNTPQQARIFIIDPKLGVDYFAFENLEHLEGGVIDDQDNATKQLKYLVEEMDRRYMVLRQNRVANIFELNTKMNSTERLPYLWIVHDEFAEWMMTDEYKKAVTNVVGRLGVKARAAGIFLVFAAQRPDNNVMPMQLRANLGNRLILRVDGEGTSEIALGERGAERLLGKGHLAAKLEGETSVITAQVPMITVDELETIVGLLK